MIKKLLSKLHNWYKPRKLKLLRFNYTRWRPQPKPLRYRSITKNHEVYKNILKEREKAEANK